MKRIVFCILVMIALAILVFWAWQDYAAVVSAGCPQLMR